MEQVSLTQDPLLPDGCHPLGPPSGLVVSKLTFLRCLRLFSLGTMKAKADQIGFQLPTQRYSASCLQNDTFVEKFGKHCLRICASRTLLPFVLCSPRCSHCLWPSRSWPSPCCGPSPRSDPHPPSFSHLLASLSPPAFSPLHWLPPHCAPSPRVTQSCD